MSPTLLLSSFISSCGGDTSSRLRYLLSSRLAAGGERSCTWERLRARGSASASNVCCSGAALLAAVCDLLLSNSPGVGVAWLGVAWVGVAGAQAPEQVRPCPDLLPWSCWLLRSDLHPAGSRRSAAELSCCIFRAATLR